MKLNVERSALLDTLTTNRGAHRAIFEEAVEGYKAEAVKQLNDYIERIKSGSLKRVYVSLPQPEEHTHDYDRVIGLILLSTDDQIPLTDQEYENYVLDDWAWKRQFITTNSVYSMTAAAQLESDQDDD